MAVVAGEWEEGELAVPRRCKHCVVNGRETGRRGRLMSEDYIQEQNSISSLQEVLGAGLEGGSSQLSLA
jgi:hypothetical protein